MKSKRKQIADLKDALLDLGISAAITQRKLEKLQKEYTTLEAVLDVTTEKYLALVREMAESKNEQIQQH